MGRRAGSRNPDFESNRAALVDAAMARLAQPDGVRVSFRELAAACSISVATMRHYFGTREGLIRALLERCNMAGQRYLFEVATEPIGPPCESLAWLLARIGEGFQRGPLARVHAIGLSSGLLEPTLGPAYLREIFDPTVEAVEARLARHVARGELVPTNVRHMALALISPAILALLHQGVLGGASTRPLSYEAFCADHLAAFLRAYGTGFEAPAEPGAVMHRSRGVRAAD